MNNTKKVDDFISVLEHPLKAELAAIRTIITNANPKIEEDINGQPQLFYKEDFMQISLLERVNIIT